MRLFLVLFVLSACVAGAEKDETTSLQAICETFPKRLIQDERLSTNDAGFFARWQKDQAGKIIEVKIRWDGGHNGGYCSVTIDRKTYPVKVDFVYSGELPKKPRHEFKPRIDKCRKTGKMHYKITRTGKEVTVKGELTSIPEPIKQCRCGKGELFKIKIKAESVK